MCSIVIHSVCILVHVPKMSGKMKFLSVFFFCVLSISLNAKSVINHLQQLLVNFITPSAVCKTYISNLKTKKNCNFLFGSYFVWVCLVVGIYGQNGSNVSLSLVVN